MTQLPQPGRIALVVLRDGRQLEGELIARHPRDHLAVPASHPRLIELASWRGSVSHLEALVTSATEWLRDIYPVRRAGG